LGHRVVQEKCKFNNHKGLSRRKKAKLCAMQTAFQLLLFGRLGRMAFSAYLVTIGGVQHMKQWVM
jgi:hypothetical protein